MEITVNISARYASRQDEGGRRYPRFAGAGSAVASLTDALCASSTRLARTKAEQRPTRRWHKKRVRNSSEFLQGSTGVKPVFI